MEQNLKKKIETGASTKDTAQYNETVGNLQLISSNSEECADLASHVIDGRPDEGTATPRNRSEGCDANPKKDSKPSENKDEPIHKPKTLSQMGFNAKNEIWGQLDQPPKDNLYELLRCMIEEHIKPDVQICIGAYTFNCHLIVLKCYSEFFMECIEEKLITLPAEKVTPNAFKKVYEWMLADQPILQREGLLKVFSAASFLRIQSLVDQCWLCFDDSERFNEDTALMLYMEARLSDLETLKMLMLSRVCKFFLPLVASQEFLSLDINEVRTILSLNTIGVNTECEVFFAAIRWLDHDWQGRNQHMLKAIKSVRFSLMPPCFLVSLYKNPDCETVARITRDLQVSAMITEGISYTTAQLCCGGNHEEICKFMEWYNMASPNPRQWIFDPGCPYHKHVPRLELQYLTYKQFQEYIEALQEMGSDHWRELEAM